MRNYPKGRLSGEDDGATEIGIASDIADKRVIIRFQEPMRWIAFDFVSGFQLLVNLANHLS